MQRTESIKRKRSLGLEAYDSGSGEDESSAFTQAHAHLHVEAPAEAASSRAQPRPPNRPAQTPTPPKRKRVKRPWIHNPPVNGENKMAKLSDELLLRILKGLGIKEIMQCSLVNKKWRELASDGEVWRGLYYDKFVRKGEKEWLTEMKQEDRRRRDDHGIWGGGHGQDRIPWMARYKLGTNWWKGKAQMSIIHVEDRPPILESTTTCPPPKPSPKPSAQMHNGTLYTADAQYGLRAWHLSSLDRSAGASTSWDDYTASQTRSGKSPAQAPLHAVPTALKIDAVAETAQIAIGFEDGSWSLWDIPHRGQSQFKRICSSDEPNPSKAVLGPGAAVVEIALHSPYVFTITSLQRLRLHKLIPTNSEIQPLAPLLLHELTSHTSWPPYALAIRSTQSTIIASIAYAVPSFRGNWSMGLQEMHVDDKSGKVFDTRIVIAVQGGWFPTSSNPSHPQNTGLDPEVLSRFDENRLTISYNHPHVVVGSGDNGLWRYDIHASQKTTTIESLSYLLGHTSGVVGVDVDKKGKCVSVQRGGAVHVRWLCRMGGKKMDADVHVTTGITEEQLKEIEMSCKEFHGVTKWEKEWVGSDEERIVVLRGGKLFIYDFR